MKKQNRRVSLHRETLHSLETADLGQIAAGVYTAPPVCENSGNARNTCSARC